ncbi:MAG: M48 family metallopeptidase [Salinivirgaceae bacterium]|nr:M48 family metallopeptidase [Salinivirgaceae bacterium]
MYTSIFYIIIGIIVFEFIFEKYFDWLNSSWRGKPIPEELNGIYDDDKYKKQQEYAKVNSRFSNLSSAFSFLLIIGFLFLHGFGKLNHWVENYVEHPIAIGLMFFGILFFALDIVGLPFSLYQTFVIEERFGFNKTTKKIFILDKLKGYLVSIVLGGVIYSIVYKLFEVTGDLFWIYCWVFIAGFMLFMTLFYSNLIVPLFNKQTPLDEGELKNAINEFSQKVGFTLKNIYQINGSKRSTRANAYFTGLGPKKRIVLYDTLINDLSTEEIVAVLAHEIGHYKKRHTLSGLVISMLQLGLMLYLLSLFISNPLLSEALGVNQPAFHIGLIAFSLLYSPISTVTGLLMNILSRKNEYQADNFAAENYHAMHLISGLKKLSSSNLSNLTPHPAYVFINYSHPSLINRIRNLIRLKDKF